MNLYQKALEAMERELFPRVLNECGWNQSLACRRLGINRATLRARLKALGISIPKVKRRYVALPPHQGRTLFPGAKRAHLRYVMNLVGEGL